MLSDQRPNEDLVDQSRRHWWWLVRQCLPSGLLIVGLLAGQVLLNLWPIAWPSPWGSVIAVGLVLTMVLALLHLGWLWVEWSNDQLIVTNQRIVAVRKQLFLIENRREIPLPRVQNVSDAIDGPLGAILGYGRLRIEVAGSPPITVDDLPQPGRLRQRILTLLIQQQQQQRGVDQAVADTAVRTALGWAEPVAGAGPAPQGAVEEHRTWYRHWWYLLRAIGRSALLVLLPLAGLTQVGRLNGLAYELLVLLIAALGGLVVVGLANLVWELLSWRNDVYILEGNRLQDIHRAPFNLRREVKETTLSRVQDVSYRIPHPLAFLLDYGDVVIETAGSTQLTFYGVAHPRAVHAEISQRLAAARSAEARLRQQQTRDEILALLGAYHRLARPVERPPHEPPSLFI